MSKTASVLQIAALLAVLTAIAWLHPLVAGASPAAAPMVMTTQMPMPQTTPTSELERDRALALIPDSGLATPATGTEWSIFNHRASGFFVLMWGLTAFVAGLQYPRRTWFRFVPPVMLFGLAEMLFLRINPKAWPSGPINYWVSLQDPSALEHQIFVLLIIAMGIVELLRAADRLPKMLQIFALPALALFGAIFLFFHKHGGLAAQMMMQNPSMAKTPAMQQMNESMATMKTEHLWFSITGFALVPAKLLADAGVIKGRLGATLWTVFVILLGVYMLGYTE
jgi:hypothetical protein